MGGGTVKIDTASLALTKISGFCLAKNKQTNKKMYCFYITTHRNLRVR